MILHVVTFSWKPEVTPSDVDRLHAALARLPSVIPQLVRYEHGPNLGLSRGTADYAVCAVVRGIDDLEAYLDHPEHARVVRELTSRMFATRQAVQLEVAT